MALRKSHFVLRTRGFDSNRWAWLGAGASLHRRGAPIRRAYDHPLQGKRFDGGTHRYPPLNQSWGKQAYAFHIKMYAALCAYQAIVKLVSEPKAQPLYRAALWCDIIIFSWFVMCVWWSGSLDIASETMATFFWLCNPLNKQFGRVRVINISAWRRLF